MDGWPCARLATRDVIVRLGGGGSTTPLPSSPTRVTLCDTIMTTIIFPGDGSASPAALEQRRELRVTFCDTIMTPPSFWRRIGLTAALEQRRELRLALRLGRRGGGGALGLGLAQPLRGGRRGRGRAGGRAAAVAALRLSSVETTCRIRAWCLDQVKVGRNRPLVEPLPFLLRAFAEPAKRGAACCKLAVAASASEPRCFARSY